MRLLLEVVEAIRQEWPAEGAKPFRPDFGEFDRTARGWSVENFVVLARELKRRGVDVVDCSSGGFTGAPIWRMTGRASVGQFAGETRCRQH